MINEINNLEEFNKFVQENDMVICDIFGTWCQPCKMLAPILEDASISYKEISFIKVDVDKVDEVAMQFGITAVPTVLFFKGGKLVHYFTGYQGAELVKKEIKKAFNI